jgi:hypothetical protein
LYLIPLARAASSQAVLGPFAWVYSAFLLIGKFAEFQGALAYLFEQLTNRSQKAIEYKRE